MTATTLKPWEILARLRQVQPVVHHLTNWVTIYDCAQVVKVLGASPVMAHAKEEVAQMTGLASALVLNIGTLTPDFIEAMLLAARAANARGIPVVLDACGAGATTLRDESSLRLLNEARIDIVKGNASEIARLSGAQVQTKGVDATEVHLDLRQMAQALARAAAVGGGGHRRGRYRGRRQENLPGEKWPPADGPRGGHRLYGHLGHRRFRRGGTRPGRGGGRGPGVFWRGRGSCRPDGVRAGQLQGKAL